MNVFKKLYRNYGKSMPKFLKQPLLKWYYKLFKTVHCVKCNVSWERASFVYKNESLCLFDYVRHSSLELVAREIHENKIAGNVAELGVFQGHFAQYINKIFPDKKLYLFDTFEGFNENEVEIEKNLQKFVPSSGIFSHTCIDIVLSKMKYKQNCIIKKGFFPETAKDLNDTFAFVSIDVDLSEPIYNGLCWFYPRLEKGGYIFVHDYNDKTWTGANVGVKKFSSDYKIPYFPLSDHSGSVIFMK